MSNEYTIISAKEARKTTAKKKGPMARFLDQVGDDYWTYRDVSEHVGVHVETLRRICRLEDEHGMQLVDAPSHAMRTGKSVLYLFDLADVREVEEFMISRGYSVTKRVNPKKKLGSQ